MTQPSRAQPGLKISPVEPKPCNACGRPVPESPFLGCTSHTCCSGLCCSTLQAAAEVAIRLDIRHRLHPAEYQDEPLSTWNGLNPGEDY